MNGSENDVTFKNIFCQKYALVHICRGLFELEIRFGIHVLDWDIIWK